MNQKITDIQTRLRRNLFLSEEKKRAILKKIETDVSEGTIEKLYNLLEKTDHMQTELLKKAVQKNPHFLSDINQMINKQKIVQLKGREESDRTNEANELTNLEAEFDEIFS